MVPQVKAQRCCPRSVQLSIASGCHRGFLYAFRSTFGANRAANWSDRLGGNFARHADRKYEDSGVGWRIWKRPQNATTSAIRRYPSRMDPMWKLACLGLFQEEGKHES